MSQFSTDKQTLEELNLLGKFRQGSVYHLFNQVKTRGGEQLMEEMFRSPLQDAAAINRRTEIFRFFQDLRVHFSFDVQQLSQMREYLDAGASRGAVASLVSIVVKRTLSSLTRDERYKKIVQGMQAVIVTLNRCESIAAQLSRPGPFADRLQKIRNILADPQVEKIRKLDIYQALPVRTLALYDHLLRSKFTAKMEDLLLFIHELDVYIAVSDVARQRGFTWAKALEPAMNKLEAVDLAHPCIINGIGNRISMEENSNVLFLTGANMAGKSTLMKSIGIGLYLAHIGFPVAAASMEFSVREGLYTSINVADNIGLGYSHFYAEVVRVKQAAEAAASGGRLMLMFDELFKGTNVKDAYDGTLAVTEAFANYRDCLFIVSTHIIEVGEALKQMDNIQFVFMPTIMDGVHPSYTYKLEQGITEDRQGMLIIRNEGILEMLESSIA